MCLILTIVYQCAHKRPMPAPVLNACEPKETISRVRKQDIRCAPETATHWEIASSNVCPMCSADIYHYEKRYELVRKMEALGYEDRTSPMRPLSPDDYRLWQIWVADRERFRQIGVRGGANGELGQGQWSLRPWGQGGGFEEWYPFDGFLGKMGPYERKEVKGLEALYEALGSDEEGPQDGVVGANTDGNEVGLGGEGGEMAEEKAEGKSEMELEPQAKSKAEATGDAKLEAMGEVKEDTKADGSGTGGTKKKNKKKGKKGKGQKEVEEKGQGAE